jgi:hypothetical protein
VVPEILQPDVLSEKKILPGMYYELDPILQLNPLKREEFLFDPSELPG